MAVDSRDKRASALTIPPFVVAPLADGTIGAQDREQATWIYSGIAPASPVPGAVRPEDYIVLWAAIREGEED